MVVRPRPVRLAGRSELAGSYIKLGKEYGDHKVCGPEVVCVLVFKYMEDKRRYVLVFCDASGGRAAAAVSS